MHTAPIMHRIKCQFTQKHNILHPRLRGKIDLDLIPLSDVTDLAAEKARVEREIRRAEEEAAGLTRKLSNHDFLEKAPGKVVKDTQQRHRDVVARKDKLEDMLRRLG